MAEEMVAWIDESGNLIKPIPISLANSDPQYLHPEVAILLFDQAGRVLITKRATTKKVMPGIWICTSAGHVTHGETIDHAAHRELSEEIGFDASPLVQVAKIFNHLPNETHLAHWYLGRYQAQKITLDPHESDGYLWLSQDELASFCLSNNLGTTTKKIAKRYWSGEWDHLLK